MRVTLCLLLLALAGLARARETPVLITDLSRDGNYPAQVTVVGSLTFYVSFDPAHGEELWVYDGTAARMVADLEPGPNGFGPRDLVALGGKVYFHGTGTHLAELWSSDGTAAGTIRLYTFPASAGFGIEGMQVAGNRLYFRGNDPQRAYPWELFTSDGTASGTHELQTTGVPWLGRNLAASLPDGRIFFEGSSRTGNFDVWVSDGTQAGTHALTSGLYVGPTLRAAGSQVFFSGNPSSTDAELWVSDGTTAGTHLVKDIRPGGVSSQPIDLMPLGSRVVFFANDGTHGMEPWISDGTADGTNLLADLSPESGSGIAPNAVMDDLGTQTPVYEEDNNAIGWIDGRVFFENGGELWTSDGTAAGTKLVTHIRPDAGAYPTKFTGFGRAVLFLANGSDAQGQELWISDGTAAGTHLVRDLAPGPSPSFAGEFAVGANGVFFRAFDGVDGAKLWVTDGTAAGTKVVDDRFTMSFDSILTGLTASGGRVFFNYGEYNGQAVSLWSTDGTAAGTARMVGPLPPLSNGLNTGYTFPIVPLPGGACLWTPPVNASNTALTYSDGTAAGSGLLDTYVTEDSAVTSPRNFTVFQGGCYFSYIPSRFVGRTWIRVDLATLARTEVPLATDPAWVGPQLAGSHLYFTKVLQQAAVPLQQLLQTTGDPATAVELTPVGGMPFNGVSGFVDFGGRTYFNVNRYGLYEVWRTTAAGTGIESFLAGRANDHLQVVGTRLIMTSADGVVGTDGQAKVVLAPATAILGSGGGHAFLFAADPKASAAGTLWITDGTLAGTRVAAQLGAGCRLDFSTMNRGVVYFTVSHDGSIGRDFWRSDGTTDGTYIVYTDPGIDSARALSATTVAATDTGKLIFVARDPVHGLELFRIDTEPAVDQPAPLINSSVRARIAPSGEPVIMGCSLAGDQPSVLVRGVGPTLAGFGVGDAATDPRLTVYAAGAAAVGTNDNWDAPGASAADPAVATAVGAFALPAGSTDAAWTQALAPGGYTVHVQGEPGRSVLAEVYLRNAATAAVTNVSCRNPLQSGDDVLIIGFALAGPGHRRVLVRAVGPGLAKYGVGDYAADPMLELHDAAGATLGTNDNWSDQPEPSAVDAAVAATGAFKLDANSADAALVRDLNPGAYTVVARDHAARGGEVLIEVYAVP